MNLHLFQVIMGLTKKGSFKAEVSKLLPKGQVHPVAFFSIVGEQRMVLKFLKWNFKGF